MIYSHLTWSDRIEDAPRGEMVTTTYHQMVKGEIVERQRTEHVPTKILALTNCGKVIPTYWIPARHTASGAVLHGGLWSGLATGEEPLRWALWPDAAELMASHSAISCAISITEEEDA